MLVSTLLLSMKSYFTLFLANLKLLKTFWEWSEGDARLPGVPIGANFFPPACGRLGTSLLQYGFRCLNSLQFNSAPCQTQSLQLYHRSAQETASHESQRHMDFCRTKKASSGETFWPWLSCSVEKQVISNWSCRKPVQGSCKAGVSSPVHCFIFSHTQILFFIPAAS